MDFQFWFQIGWLLHCQPIRSNVWTFLSISYGFERGNIIVRMTPGVTKKAESNTIIHHPIDDCTLRIDVHSAAGDWCDTSRKVVYDLYGGHFFARPADRHLYHITDMTRALRYQGPKCFLPKSSACRWLFITSAHNASMEFYIDVSPIEIVMRNEKLLSVARVAGDMPFNSFESGVTKAKVE